MVFTAFALVGVNFKAMDQSGNHFVIQFGEALLKSRKEGAILLTQGDMVTNSIRYLHPPGGCRPPAHLSTASHAVTTFLA